MTLPEIENEVMRLAQIIAVPPGLLPTFGPSILDEVPFLLHDADGYHLAFRERGQVSMQTFQSAGDLLCAVFEDVTWSMAYAASHSERRTDVDSRRHWFAVQVELMRRLSPAWGEREAGRQQEILHRHPFDDKAIIRAGLARTYREQGHGDETAWAMACGRYPLP